MITNIILSKDRGLQLDTLLSSLEEYSRINFNNVVIYTYSNEEFKKGYETVQERRPNVKFVHEINLKKDILWNMNTLQTCFMVDDIIMFKESPKIHMMKEHTCFSLRLGDNIPEVHKNYPLSLDGHIFRTNEIKPLIEGMSFSNPNKLESHLQKYKSKFKVIFDYQCLVSIPHNRVSNGSHCKFSGLYSAKILNDYLLDGYKISYNKMDFRNIDNVHTTTDYKFKLYE